MLGLLPIPKRTASLAVRFFLCSLLWLLPLQASALSPSLDRDVADKAWQTITKIEVKNNIPRGLLLAISLVETGLGMDGHYLPWPYTLNVNATSYKKFATATEALAYLTKLDKADFRRYYLHIGENYYKNVNAAFAREKLLAAPVDASIRFRGRGFSEHYSTPERALEVAQNLLKAGIKNMDVGLMQVNWYYHGEQFKSIADAFDPYKNVSYAVSYLRKHRQTRDWWGSVGRYHSGTGNHAKNYVRAVWEMYRRIHRLK